MEKTTQEQQRWARDIINKHKLTLITKDDLFLRKYEHLDRTNKVNVVTLDLKAKKMGVRRRA